MGKIELLPSVYNGGVVDFLYSQQDPFLEFLFGVYANVLQKCPGHFPEKRFDKV